MRIFLHNYGGYRHEKNKNKKLLDTSHSFTNVKQTFDLKKNYSLC